MFRQIAALAGGVEKLINEPSPFVAARLEYFWALRPRGRKLSGLPMTLMVGSRDRQVLWDHLIYAYMIENTRAADIFQRVVFEAAHGERLGILRQPQTYAWLRTTEDLLHSFGLPALAFTTVSQLRPHAGATRRNAYYRMFAMDLNHPTDAPGGTYVKAADANREFVSTFEAFLREAWRGIENARNTSGPNRTDTAALADLGLRLQNMLNERRGGSSTGPNLAREEFVAVAAMSWLHLILDSNNTVITDLQATAASPEERLRRLGERVGIPSHANSHSYFLLAPRTSWLLLMIEDGWLSTSTQVQALYLPAPPTTNLLRDLILEIIEHWIRATGRDLKALSVSATPTLGMSTASPPTSVTAAIPAAAPAAGATNGKSPVTRETAPV